MTPEAYQWPTDPRITDLEAENDVLARCVLDLLAGDTDTSSIRPSRELHSQGDQ